MTETTESKVTRHDVFGIPLHQIVLRDGGNVRTDYGDIAALAEQMRAKGHNNDAGVVVKVGEEYELYVGHRRYAALCLLRDEYLAAGETKKAQALHFRATSRHKRDMTPDAVMELHFMSNSGKPLTAAEQYTGFCYFRDKGKSEREIGVIIGKSHVHVSNILTLFDKGSPELLEAVRNDTLAFTLAVELVRKHPTHAAQNLILTKGQENATAKGKEKMSKQHLEPPKPAPRKAIRFAVIAHNGNGNRNDKGTAMDSLQEVKDTCDEIVFSNGGKYRYIGWRVDYNDNTADYGVVYATPSFAETARTWVNDDWGYPSREQGEAWYKAVEAWLIAQVEAEKHIAPIQAPAANESNEVNVHTALGENVEGVGLNEANSGGLQVALPETNESNEGRGIHRSQRTIEQVGAALFEDVANILESTLHDVEVHATAQGRRLFDPAINPIRALIAHYKGEMDFDTLTQKLI